MKKPNLKSLKVNKEKTRQVRSAMAQSKNVKITINIDADTLTRLKAMAEESGIPYQRLLNRKLSEVLAEDSSLESRMKKIEKELRSLKKQIAA